MTTMNKAHLRAKDVELGTCPKCLKLNTMSEKRQKCSRCGAMFSQRRPDSLKLTIAWTFTAIIFLIPANLLPMMIFNKIGSVEASTILQGIYYFIEEGMYPVSIIVFIASFMIPIAKIGGLIYLIHGVRKGSKLSAQKRATLFHIVEYLGPWSMLDIFVVGLMVGVVNLSFVTSIEAGAGSTYFALMVIFTMFAAHSFDPRLIWDAQSNDEHSK